MPTFVIEIRLFKMLWRIFVVRVLLIIIETERPAAEFLTFEGVRLNRLIN